MRHLKLTLLFLLLIGTGCSSPLHKKIKNYVEKCNQGDGIACSNLGFLGDTKESGDYIRKKYQNYDNGETYKRAIAFLDNECKSEKSASCRAAGDIYSKIGYLNSTRSGDTYKIRHVRRPDYINGGFENTGSAVLSQGYKADLHMTINYYKAGCDLKDFRSCKSYSYIISKGPFKNIDESKNAFDRFKDLARAKCENSGSDRDCRIWKAWQFKPWSAN